MKTTNIQTVAANRNSLPTIAKILWTVAFLFAIAGATLLILDMFDVMKVKLAVSLLLIDISVVTNVFLTFRYRNHFGRKE